MRARLVTASERYRYDPLWADQWQHVRSWIEESTLLDHGSEPSVLPGWTVRDLVAHLGRGFVTASMAAPADGEQPRTLLEYMSGYAPVAAQIEVATRDFAVEVAGGLLEALDRIASQAFTDMAALDADVVRGPRGPIQRADLVVTRLVELVVHGDDLMRSVPSVDGSPLLDDAVEVVAAALAAGYRAATGHPAPAGGLAWIRLASGRAPSADPHLPLL